MTALFNKSTLKSKKIETEPEKPVQLKTLLEWQAPIRPFKKRDREYYTTIAAIVFLLAVILLFLKEWLLIAVMTAMMFVAYVLATVKPELIEHQITTRGVSSGGKMYKWKDLGRFWFSNKWNNDILHIDTRLQFPGQLMLLLGEVNKKEVKEILQRNVQYEVPEENFLDKSAKWLQEKVPLEKSD